jgi:MoxR-like ATPase
MDHVLAIREGGHPQPGRLPYVCSFFWAMGDENEWPVLWSTAAEGADALGWLPAGDSPDLVMERYFEYRRSLLEVDTMPREAERVFLFLRQQPFVGLDPYLVERCRESIGYFRTWNLEAGRYAQPETEPEAARNARTVAGDLHLLGRAIESRVAEALGRTIKMQRPASKISLGPSSPWRPDGLLTFLLEYGGRYPSASVWASDEGIAVGVSPGWPPRELVGDNWQQRQGASLIGQLPEGIEFIKVNEVQAGRRVEPAGDSLPPGKVFIGRWFPGDSALARESFADDVVATVAELRRFVDAFVEAIGPLSKEQPAPPPPAPDGPDGEVDFIAQAADDLMLPEEWVREIAELLREKRQLIFYGPPGTGKTYVAMRIAKAVAQEDDARWGLVQLHPSSSYEDFFEGYRPRVAERELTYELVEGPLGRMAARALGDEGEHVLVIDEINRANVPKVFGELLFLLEYRRRPTATLYREEFTLPENLYFIGTMNTADRSIALVDAALRRRFHFVPFYPDDERLQGVLAEWLDRNEPEMAWVSNLVDAVNARLVERFDGRDFQIGPSHFMTKGLDEAKLRRIWDYSVFPLIEEQLYGEAEEIATYAYDIVVKEIRSITEAVADDAVGPSVSAFEDSTPPKR